MFLEVGPTPTLTEWCRQSVDPNLPWLTSLSPDRGEWDQLLQSVAEIYVHGVGVDWEAFDRGYGRRKLSLPTYPFQRQRCWFTKERPISEAALIPEA